MNECISKNRKIHTQIQYLIMSTEAMDIYLINNRKEKVLYQKHYSNKQKKITTQQEAEAIIKNINFLFYKTQEDYIQKLIKNILNNYTLNIECLIVQQYFKRFEYLYKKTQNHYYNLSFLENIKIQKLAITNLYIINKMHKKKAYAL